MDFLQSFSLSDLLIFSPESYFTLFELSNKALWPLQTPIILIAFVAMILLYKRQFFTPRLIFAYLGFVWLFVGYWYFGKFYSQISTYSHVLSYFFWAEASLLLLFAFFYKNESYALQKPYKKWRLIIGGGLILYGMFLHPLVSLWSWSQSFIHIELFSIAPDPTAIASIGFILLLPIRGHLSIVVIPILWLLFSILTYQAF